MLPRRDIIKRIAQRTRVPKAQVDAVLQALAFTLEEELLAQVGVNVLGLFRVTAEPRKYRRDSGFMAGSEDAPRLPARVTRLVLNIRPSSTLQRKLTALAGVPGYDEESEGVMDKYAVETEEPTDKTATAGARTCPRCGRTVDQHSITPHCPVHGTAPWEPEKKNGTSKAGT